MSPWRWFCESWSGGPGLVFVGLLLLAGGCHHAPPSPDSSAQTWIDHSAPPGGYPDVELTVVEALDAERHPGLAPLRTDGPTAPPLNALVLSGGGKFGAFTSGLLVGWSESGTRPTFDVATGISSGALVATLAFLGPKYDPLLKRFACETTANDLFLIRPCYYLLTSGAIGSSKPIQKLIKSIVTDEFLHDLRQAHCAGRHLFIGTATLQSKRLVIWDLGALACAEPGGRPDAAEMVRKVLLASVCLPGLCPPVCFDVELNGKHYTEEHTDGGSVSLAFLRFGPTPGWPEPGKPAKNWLLGSNLYVLTAGKLYADPAKGEMSFGSRLQSGVSSSLYSLHRSAVMWMHTFCSVSGMNFHLVSLPCDFEVGPASMDFQKEEMTRLFEKGHEMSRRGIHWRRTPPGGEIGEEEKPRAGVTFDAPPKPGDFCGQNPSLKRDPSPLPPMR
jgi:hypothetical protein